MGLVVIPDTADAVYLDATPSPYDRTQSLSATAQLGFGLVRPFQRDQKNDFACAGGADLVRACVGQILAMKGANGVIQGELEWDPARGSLLYLLRHKSNGLVIQQLGRVYVVTTLKRYEPRVRVTRVNTSLESIPPDGTENALIVQLAYDVLASPGASNAVLFPGINQTVTISRAAS